MTRISANPPVWIRWALSLAVAVLTIAGVASAAKQKKKTHVAHRRSKHTRVTHRYNEVRIQPDRVREIQEALAKAGVYHDEPSGRWDTTTQDAMREYQKQNGFSPTGLPEAKPLLLLGLGPHPLPPGLGPFPAAQPAADSDSHPKATENDEGTASSSAKKPTSSQ